jgi:uncharacterized protein YukE
MANYDINPQMVYGIVGDITSTSRELDQSLVQLEGSVAKFTLENEGQAPAAYADAQRLWDAGHKEMKAALATGAISLGDIVDRYVLGDKQGAAIFS